MSRPRPAVLAPALAGLVMALSGCGSAADHDATKGRDVEDRPAMETVLQRYERMRDDLFAQLAERFGPRDWAEPANSPGLGRSGCDEQDAERVHLPDMAFQGSYAAADREQVKELVQEVGRSHGFEDVAVVVDEPDNLDIVGEDGLGGRYEFGMAANTVLGLRTGCHVWEDTPPAS